MKDMLMGEWLIALAIHHQRNQHKLWQPGLSSIPRHQRIALDALACDEATHALQGFL